MIADYLHQDAVAANDHLVADFEAYSAWRSNLTQAITRLSRWLAEQDLNDAQTGLRLQNLIERLKNDKLNIAFVAEFSRGKSELINSIFFAHYGQRILPSSAGRTTMCPTELLYDAAQKPSIRLLPIETRARDLATQSYRNFPDEWHNIELDLGSPEALQAAFKELGRTRHVAVADAKTYGLYDEEDPDQALVVDANGMVDIPCWRYAIINFPHPLLEKGLVILDTPGLNAIGAEPELTLDLLPNAHAILFILAADTGVTKSDIAVWRNHIAAGPAGRKGRLVVLNKIDGLWDELKSAAEIEGEISRQVKTSADLLNVPIEHVFPVSAQKALIAKVQQDDTLLGKSRLAALEHALSNELIPGKQDIVRDAAHGEIEELVLATRNLLMARGGSIREQLDELTGLRGKNRDVILQMMDKVQADKTKFEQGLLRFQALRSVFTQQTNKLYALLGKEALNIEILRVRTDMDKTKFSFGEGGLRSTMDRFFQSVNKSISQSAEQVAEIQAMMAAMYVKFCEEHGLGKITPPPFSTLKYHKELARLEKTFREHFNTVGNLITTSKTQLTRKFFESVASRVAYVFDVANRDVESWLKAVMAPMETQVREHQLQLRRRLESIKRIHKATDTLEDRISELAEIDTQLSAQIAELDALLKEIYTALNTEIGEFAQKAA